MKSTLALGRMGARACLLLTLLISAACGDSSEPSGPTTGADTADLGSFDGGGDDADAGADTDDGSDLVDDTGEDLGVDLNVDAAEDLSDGGEDANLDAADVGLDVDEDSAADTADMPDPVDECEAGTFECPEGTTCSDLELGYECLCPHGYELDGDDCVDIDECAAGTRTCQPGRECINLAGTSRCDCMDGLAEDEEGACVDVDECAGGIGLCECGVCANGYGTYACDYTACGLTPPSCAGGEACPEHSSCEGGSCVADEGYSQDLDGNFVRDDECVLNLVTCEGADEVCLMGDDGGVCQCAPGFAPTGAEGACQDIDECEDDAVCGIGTCANTLGSFTCACPDGFLSGGGSCVDIDECAEFPCGDSSTCRNLVGSYLCECPDDTTLVEGECLIACEAGCDVDATCESVDGLSLCVCQEGLVGDGGSCRDVALPEICAGLPLGQRGVFRVPAEGEPIDLTDTLASGTDESPAQYAFDGAPDEQLVFCPGTYHVELELAGSGTLVGYTGLAGPAVLDGPGTDGTDATITAATSETLRIEGVTIRDGKPGVECTEGELVIEEVVVEQNSANDRGGGISLVGCSATVTESLVQDNHGGGNPGGGIYVESGTLTLVDSLVTGNTSALGSGVGAWSDSPVVCLGRVGERSGIVDNISENLWLFQGDLELTNCDIENPSELTMRVRTDAGYESMTVPAGEDTDLSCTDGDCGGISTDYINFDDTGEYLWRTGQQAVLDAGFFIGYRVPTREVDAVISRFDAGMAQIGPGACRAEPVILTSSGFEVWRFREVWRGSATTLTHYDPGFLSRVYSLDQEQVSSGHARITVAAGERAIIGFLVDCLFTSLEGANFAYGASRHSFGLWEGFVSNFDPPYTVVYANSDEVLDGGQLIGVYDRDRYHAVFSYTLVEY